MELKCFVCGSDEKTRVYMECYHEGEKKVVCVHCLPPLIHGAH